jgi:hypothetical protein
MKNDVRSTLETVCQKVLLDQSVSQDVRDKRAEGLLIIGEVFYNHTHQQNNHTEKDDNETACLDALATFFCEQSGLSEVPVADTDTVREHGHTQEAEEGWPSREALVELLRRLDGEDGQAVLSVRELKDWLLRCGQENSSSFLEKSELVACLRAVVTQQLASTTDK